MSDKFVLPWRVGRNLLYWVMVTVGVYLICWRELDARSINGRKTTREYPQTGLLCPECEEEVR